METYDWNPRKDEQLKKERGVSFAEVVDAIRHGRQVDVYDHPNQARYPGQKIAVVIIDNYACLVPHLETRDGFFLKTVIPSRKATKKHIGGDNVRKLPARRRGTGNPRRL